jgi:tripartite-type tricarboxylate transporter receptor subunit TctC
MADDVGKWPERPVRLIVPQGAGGITDAMGRIVADKLGRLGGQPVVVENKPGVAGSVGVQTLLQARRDGYTLLVAPLSYVAVLPHVQKLPYDPLTELQAVARVADSVYGMGINPAVPAKDLREFIAYAKANPGKIAFASGGPASITHLAGEIIAESAGIKLLHVPYAGTAAAMNDLLAGTVQLLFEGTIFQQAKNGNVRLIGVTGSEREPDFPDVPAIREVVPGFEVANWFGIVVGAGTPPALVQRIGARLNDVADDPDVRDRLNKVGLKARRDTPQEMADDMRHQSERYGVVVKRLGITIQ